jgi:hypothetical protein
MALGHRKGMNNIAPVSPRAPKSLKSAQLDNPGTSGRAVYTI